jgi:hypothetical protein
MEDALRTAAPRYRTFEFALALALTATALVIFGLVVAEPWFGLSPDAVLYLYIGALAAGVLLAAIAGEDFAVVPIVLVLAGFVLGMNEKFGTSDGGGGSGYAAPQDCYQDPRGVICE